MEKIRSLLKDGPKIVNIGLDLFHEANKKQNIDSIHVKWSPPIQGDKELLKILDKLL